MAKQTYQLALNYGLAPGEPLSGDYVRGWGAGKSLFLQNAEAYLKTLGDYTGWQSGRKGKKEKAVSINPGGSAVAGDVSAIYFPKPTSRVGVYVNICAYVPWGVWDGSFVRLPGDVVDHNKEVSIMWRICTREDPYGCAPQHSNQWLPGTTYVQQLAAKMKTALARAAVHFPPKPIPRED